MPKGRNLYQSKKKIPPSLAQCLICSVKNECLRASALSNLDKQNPDRLREYVVSQLWGHRVENHSTSEGTRIHKIIEQRRGVVTNPNESLQRLRNRESLYFTLGVCSVRYMFRGTPDAVHAEFNDRTLRLTVIEDKTHITGSYANQLHVYGLVLTDPYCFYTTPYTYDEPEITRRRFYEDLDFDGTVEVFTQFNLYRERDGEIVEHLQPSRPFSREFALLDKANYFGVKAAKDTILRVLYEPKLLSHSSQTKFHARTGEIYLPASEKKSQT